jgi:citrate lyase subunit beta / citryl-CoA lyase
MSLPLRSPLFVPGDRPDRVLKALRSPTDAVVVDLEDAVADAAKTPARDLVTQAITEASFPSSVRLYLRVNAIGTTWFDGDVDTCRVLGDRLDGVVLPKATAAADVLRLADELSGCAGITILPIVETAGGVLDAHAIATSTDRVETLLFGAADLCTELRVQPTPDGTELLHARSQVVLAAAAAGCPRPVDGPYLRLDDPDGLRRACAHARRLGFGGKATIHPTQLDPVRSEFAPDEHEVQWARRVDQAFAHAEEAGRGSIRLDDGTFVDYPVARRARAILADADHSETV